MGKLSALKVRYLDKPDMPADRIELLQKFLSQNGGSLSERAPAREFAAFTNEEAEQVEMLYRDTFGMMA